MSKKSNVEKVIELLRNTHNIVGDKWVNKETGIALMFVGHEETMAFLLKYDIDKVICNGLGFSTKDQKWYGWSHRAIFGFGIGSRVDKCSSAYMPKNRTDFIKELKENKLNSDTHSITLWECGDKLSITYTYTGDKTDKSQDKFIGNKSELKYRFTPEGYYTICETVQCKDKTECAKLLFEQNNIEGTEYPADVAAHVCEYTPAESEEFFTPWGKGEWTAGTLEDARQMAEDFMSSVS